MGMIDTHAHLMSETIYNDIDAVLKRAKDANVTRILCVCLNPKQAYQALELKKRYDWIDIAVGFHPNDLLEVQEEDWEALETLMKHPDICALGEIGMDYHYDDVPKEIQKEGFIRQLKMAHTYQKPVIIHMRDAIKDTMELLKQYKKTTGVMHCFSGSLETAKEAIAMDMYISFAGPLTFKNARGLPEVAKQLPLNRIFVETDCPYLTPHPHRGKSNEPMYVSYTFAYLCELHGISLEEGMKQLTKNYENFLHVK